MFPAVNTYIDIEKGYLYVIYLKSKNLLVWESFFNEQILTNEMFIDIDPINEDFICCIFNIAYEYKEEFNCFLEGKYSRFKESSKDKILSFYDKRKVENKHLKIYLYPNNHYDDFSEYLNIDKEILIKNIELCSIPDFNKEIYDKEEIIKVNKVYGN
jgi:hypothetical protein